MRDKKIGHKHSEETKRKIQQAHLNRPKSEEHKKHLSKSKQGKKIPKDKIHHHTLEERIKQRNHPSVSKQVQCVETGIIYPSAAEAARQLGMGKNHHINECITNPQRYKTAGGYH